MFILRIRTSEFLSTTVARLYANVHSVVYLLLSNQDMPFQNRMRKDHLKRVIDSISLLKLLIACQPVSRMFFVLGLYAHKYEEEFQPYMQQFVTAVWNLLMNHGAEVKYDLLTSNAIQVQKGHHF